MSGPALQAAGLSAGYHGIPAVSDLDLEVSAGEVVALLGCQRGREDHHYPRTGRPDPAARRDGAL